MLYSYYGNETDDFFQLLSIFWEIKDCPENESDFRHQQCSYFDETPFEGVRYEWVPYLKAPNPCELNCMPRGERFYYRHKAKVIDGTRCNDESNDVCVDGQCQVCHLFHAAKLIIIDK